MVIRHSTSGIKLHFNAFDALTGWKKEDLPAVEVPAAAKWKDRSQPSLEILMNYDYTFTTPYCGSETIETTIELDGGEISKEGTSSICWEDCEEKIDVSALAPKEPIIFYDEVILYEDELSDNGTSLLTVKVRVMPNSWFLLLRFWLRVDGVLMRLRDTRMQCIFDQSPTPVVLRECSWREATFPSLSAKGYPSDSQAYNDPNIISQRLPVILQKTQKLKFAGNL